MSKFETKNISDIFVDIFISITTLSYLYCERKNSLHSMLDDTENKNIFIHKFEQELLPTSMLSFWFFYSVHEPWYIWKIKTCILMTHMITWPHSIGDRRGQDIVAWDCN